MKKPYIKSPGIQVRLLVITAMAIHMIASTLANAQQCLPISTLPCPQIKISAPVHFSFDGTDGGLADKSGTGIGFRMVDKPSSPLASPSNPSIPGYEPANIQVLNGRLNITTTAGIAIRNPSQSANTNSQVNALGIGINASQKLVIQVTLIQPSAGTGKFEQAGLWFGLDEDNYLKFDIVSAGNGRSQVELIKEVNAISEAADAIKTTAMQLSSSNVTLKLVLDNESRTIQGLYSINGGTDISVGTLSFPAAFFAGTTLADGTTNNVSFAGVYATHRNASTPITFSFDDFKIEAQQETPAEFTTINWSTVAPQPFTVNEAQGKVVNGKLYTFGGFDSQKSTYTPTKRSYAYDPSANTWTSIADLPYLPNGPDFGGITHAGITTDGTNIYLGGGYVSNSNGTGQVFGTKQVWRYNILQNNYTRLPDLPIDISCGQMEFLNGKLHHIGGSNLSRTQDLGNHYVLDLNNLAQGWKTLAPLPVPRHHAGSAVFNGKIYIIGGQNGHDSNLITTKDVQAYDPITNTWSKMADLPVPSGANGRGHISSATVVIGSRILVLAGETVHITGRTNMVSAYTPISDTWQNLTPLPQTRFSGVAGILDGNIYYTGGSGTRTTYKGVPVGNISPITKELKFNPEQLNFSVAEGGTAPGQSATLSSNEGSPAINLAKSANSNWLILPNSTTTGSLSFNINAAGLAPGKYHSTVTASATGYNSATLGIHLDVNTPPASKFLLFSHATQNVEVVLGKTQSVLDYISTSDNQVISTSLTATDDEGKVPAWLTVNGKLLNGISYTTGSEISFTLNTASLSIGTYNASVTASANGYASGSVDIKMIVKSESGGALANYKINFQDEPTVPATGWLRDFGQPFGPRTSANQGTGLTYGWKKPADGAPLDLSPNGRNRNTPSDMTLATFMHMQANQFPSFSGTKEEGMWEMQVPNGTYDITVSVGDASYIDSKHTLNIEGVNIINNFTPTQAQKFFSATTTVTVTDGHLTIDAVGGTNTKINSVIIQPSKSNRPAVVSVNPENGSKNVPENTSISTSILNLPNGGINNLTITSLTVYLAEEATGALIPANVNGTGGGDAITLVPVSTLKQNTTYRFSITDGVKDLSGASFIPYSSTFTTGTGSSSGNLNVRFDKVDLPNTKGRHTTLNMGPDGKLYATTIDGLIKRFTVNTDGTLGQPEIIYSIQDAYGARQTRLLVGFAFDPSSTAANLIAYASHSSFVFLNGPEWDGKITRLSGPNLQNVQDVVINLPRSTKDHLTNSLVFGPDKALYFPQGSNTAMGREDKTWGLRPENLLSAAILRLDLTKLGTLPLNVKTSEGGGAYNPYASNAPLTIYASGTRNAYDLVWHSNGKLYVPTNGSAAGGNSPASVMGTLRPDGSTYSGPSIPALTNIQQTQKDFLFRVEKGGYYGHPNPLRGEYVMNGGNPTNAIDPAQVDAYPVGTAPDANWRGYSFDFDNNKSPNGIIEYQNNAFGGALKGKLLVVRYSQNDDIICLTPGGANLDIVNSTDGSGIPGFSGFVDPLDLIEDVNTGNIYVSEYGGDGKITLLKPSGISEPNPSVVTLRPIADSFTRNGSFATTNYGTESTLANKNSTVNGFTRHTYLKFSLSELNTVQSAKLRLYGYNTENDMSISVVAMGVADDSWSETGITWNNAPTASTAALATTLINDVAKYYQFDVTSFVQSQVSGDKVVSLLISNPAIENRLISFNSRENSVNQPELVIETNASNTNPGIIAVSPLKIYDNDVAGGAPALNRQITIRNNGQGTLSVSGISLGGTHSNQFLLNSLPAFPANIAAGATLSFNVAFNPTSTGLKTASVLINSNDANNGSTAVSLRGLGTSGLGGTHEPSLQALMNLLEIPVNIGDDDASTAVIHSNPSMQTAGILGEEVSIPKFVKAGTGNVTIEPLAVFGPTDANPVLGMGWYVSGDANSRTELFTVSNNPASNGQTVIVNVTGVTSFDPSGATFGFYSRWPFFNNRHVYSEGALNNFTGSIPHHVRVYPYKTSGGIVPNAYIVAFEEHTSGFDYQDLVFIVKNVKPAEISSPNPELITLNPIADSYVRNGSFAGDNYGTEPSVLVKSSTVNGFTRRAYLKFSLADVPAVGSAKLRVYGKNTENEDNLSIVVFGVNDDSWAETGITWNNAPTTSTSTLSTTFVNSQEKYYEFDVTNFVKSQLSGDKIVSLVILDPSNQNKTLTFNSRENSLNKPELIINTEGGSEPNPSDPNAGIVVENLDRFPSDNVLVFSRINIPWSRDGVVYNANHDEISIRIKNTGSSTLNITNFTLSNSAFFKLERLSGATYNSANLPLNISAGGFVDLTIKFIAKDLNTRVRIIRETLTIVSNDAKTPNKAIKLNGLYQEKGEGNNEPFAQEIIDAFDFKTKTGFGRNDPDKGNPTKLKGDEILSFFFVRADNSKPVHIRQMAAYHGCCNATERIMWNPKGTNTVNAVFTHIALDGQTLLPRRSTSNNLPGEGTFNPNGAFGFRIGSVDWTDATKTPSNLIGVRVWKAIDANGKVIKDAYIIGNDYLGSDFTNYDYNDNVYFVTNIKPEVEPIVLKSNPSALDFGEKLVNSNSSLSFSLSNLGVEYSDGSKDPAIQITSIEIAGSNKEEFLANMPSKTTINAKESTTISVSFRPNAQGLKIADLLVHHNGSNSPYRVPLYGIAKDQNVIVTAYHRINSGSSTAVTIGGKTWAADNQYAFDNLEPYRNLYLSDIHGTDEDAIYLIEQSSNGDKKPFRYDIPLANGNYVVRLHFAELYWGAPGSGSSGGVGSRVMSVNIEGQTLLSNFDVVKEVGKAVALVKNFPVTVSDGRLNINFSATVNRPMVCAVEVYSFSSGSSSSMLATSNLKGLTDEGLDEMDGKIKVYPNPAKDKFTVNIPKLDGGYISLVLADQYGKIINLPDPHIENETSFEFDISKLNLAPGLYFLRVQPENQKPNVIKLLIGVR